MKAWADFYDFCNADVPGVTTFAAERELRRAAQEFCKKTKCWTVELDPVTIFPNPRIEFYDLDVPDGATIVKVNLASIDGADIPMVAPGAGYGVQFVSLNQFRMLPTHHARAQIKFEAVLMPSNQAKGIDDGLFEQYAEVMASGAKARLFLQPQKPYTNPALAAIEQEEFNLAIARERIAASKAHSGAPLRTTPHYI